MGREKSSSISDPLFVSISIWLPIFSPDHKKAPCSPALSSIATEQFDASKMCTDGPQGLVTARSAERIPGHRKSQTQARRSPGLAIRDRAIDSRWAPGGKKAKPVPVDS